MDVLSSNCGPGLKSKLCEKGILFVLARLRVRTKEMPCLTRILECVAGQGVELSREREIVQIGVG